MPAVQSEIMGGYDLLPRCKTNAKYEKIMKVTILLGSVREGRKTHRVAYYVEKKLKEKGVETDLIDLGEEELPMYGLADKSEEERERIASVGKRLTRGDALIFVSPEYQDSFSGVLKNALDHYLEEFEKKAIGVVTVSSGKMAGINASIQLQLVILGVGAYPMPYKLLIPHISNSFDDQSEPQNESVIKMTEKFLNEFLWFADALVKKKREEQSSDSGDSSGQ